jgi:hypothetical protein
LDYHRAGPQRYGAMTGYLLKRGVDTINFNHIRTAFWRL